MSYASADSVDDLVCAGNPADNLRNVKYLSGSLPKIFSDIGIARTFASDETLFRAGQPSRFFYRIEAGMVRRYVAVSARCRQITGFSLPGDWIIASLTGQSRYSADAIDAVTATSFAQSLIARAWREYPAILEEFHRLAHDQLAAAEDHLRLLGHRRSEDKIAEFLLMMRDRWGQAGIKSITVHLPMPRRDIADYLGVTVETVSRTLARFARERVILLVPEGVRLMEPDILRRDLVTR